ncbi:MAG TPA: glycosyltransferase family 39 protein, partial [Acidimicrobiales bacterium]|nr:glycosyltransferase family 39 protein [Acidimicrobiales bacterium]
MVALAVVTTFGACLRAHGLSGLGLWRDDAWVALSAHVGIGEAWRMWFTAPGSDFIDRTVLVLSPGTTTWAQMPSFVAGVAAIPAVYALARCFRFGRLAGLLVATAIATAPLCVDYSTRVKEYELDILLSCAVLAAGELARRQQGRRQLAVLAVASVASFLCSASLAAVIAGVWIALAVHTWRGRRLAWPRPVVAAFVAATCGCAAVGLAFYTEISPAEDRFWEGQGAFVAHQSVGSLFSSLGSGVWHLLAYAVGLGGLTEP